MEWVAQVVELQVFREDTENWRKEGRSCYKMDENNIQILREDSIEEYHKLAKSHTTAIKQFLEEFNDDQMMFRLGAETYEEERLTAMTNRAPTTDDHEVEPTTTTTIEER